MVNSNSNQPDNHNIKDYTDFSEGVKYYLKIKKMKQSDLIRQSDLSRATINRICRNSNDNGHKYFPAIRDFLAISIGLELNNDEADKLFRVAFPEFLLLKEILNEHMTIVKANILLYENGLPLLEKRKRRKSKKNNKK